MNRTEQLIQIMKDRNLSAQDVATLLDVRLNTVEVWRCKNTTQIPAAKLELLKLKTAASA